MGSTRVLLSTVYRRFRNDFYDYFGANTKTVFRFSWPRQTSFGLRFLKQNLPGVDIIEYPTWPEYVKKLKEGWDVVGLSFYLNETGEIVRMAEEARRQGVKNLWAGNYGALTEGMAEYFDKIFVGYSEKTVGRLLGRQVETVVHPPLDLPLFLDPLHVKYKIFGILFTQRGCSIGCSFCQTPLFCPKPETVPLDSIERVLVEYRRRGIREVIILDESFGQFREHTRSVTELLARHGMLWSAMARADIVLRSLDEWIERGFVAAFIGIESMSQETLDDIGKKERAETIAELIRKAHERFCFITGYYMIGYETDTVRSIRADLIKLARLKVDFNQLCVVTPLPRTPLWYHADSTYGVFEKDWRKYDVKNLVFHHPRIKPAEMAELLDWGFRLLNPPARYREGIGRLIRRYLKSNPGFLLTSPLQAIPFDHRDRRHRWFFPPAPR